MFHCVSVALHELKAKIEIVARAFVAAGVNNNLNTIQDKLIGKDDGLPPVDKDDDFVDNVIIATERFHQQNKRRRHFCIPLSVFVVNKGNEEAILCV